MEEENENAFKHQFGKELVARIASSIGKVYENFDRRQFLSLASSLKPLEMKARVRFLRDEISKLLPSHFPEALQILMNSVKSGKLEGFDLWIYTEFIQTHGLAHREESLEALKVLTTLFTSEWAVRPFLRQFPEHTLAFLLACAAHEDEKVRRWASEGSRPRLPWGERLHHFIQTPDATLPILESLKHDEAPFVRTSVANHLNDIAKDNPHFVLTVLKKWKKEVSEKDEPKLDWITKRALRTLIKNGNPAALGLIGVDASAKISVSKFFITPKGISLGDRMTFGATIKSLSKSPQKLVIDYVLHLVKSHGGTAPKVFKCKVVNLEPGESLDFEKTHHLKKVTTRTYYPGINALELQINGKSHGKKSWVLH
jgi:3-methyladenine DNA glycosylase AlkC